MSTVPAALAAVIQNILGDSQFCLANVGETSLSSDELVKTWLKWSVRVGGGLAPFAQAIEPLLRQQILFMLLPAAAFDDSGSSRSIEVVLDDHLEELGIPLTKKEKVRLRNIVVNILQVRDLNKEELARQSKGLRDLKATGRYEQLKDAQGGRCIWCGVDLSDDDVSETLEHMAPKHLGDDPMDGSNWALACRPCNRGKGTSLHWAGSAAATSFMARKDFQKPVEASEEVRWTVLARDKACVSCARKPSEAALGLRKRVDTGLPVVANLESVCNHCT